MWTPEIGSKATHHSGRVYTVMHIANQASKNLQQFPVTVVYQGGNGLVWARPLEQFIEKFSPGQDTTRGKLEY